MSEVILDQISENRFSRCLLTNSRCERVITVNEALSRWSNVIEQQVRASNVATGLVREIIANHLDTGGKRLRAILPVWVCANLGGYAEEALDIGIGLELVHNASLIHDDVQDIHSYRRGVPTVWSRWGSGQAINVGDALILEGLARLGCSHMAREVIQEATGALLRVIEGQAMEFQLNLPVGVPGALPQTLESWTAIANRKTGAFIGACMRLGAIAARAKTDIIDGAGIYGENLGPIFQAHDDYGDLVGNKETHVRGSDLIECRASFPVLWAYENAEPSQVARIRRIVKIPREHKTTEMIEEAIQLLENTGALHATADWVIAAQKSAESHPMAEIVPGLLTHFLRPNEFVRC